MILMNDFKAEPESLRAAELAAVGRVLHSGWYVLGQEVKTFEAEWATRCGIAHAIGVGNGMDAIEIGLRALDIGEGDEVITTPMTAFATVLAIIRAGATPVLADIDPDTALLDPKSVERCITPKTKAILLVHLYGQIRDMESWLGLCEANGLALLEDCAQSHLATWNGKVAGSFGRFGAYSFYPTKRSVMAVQSSVMMAILFSVPAFCATTGRRCATTMQSWDSIADSMKYKRHCYVCVWGCSMNLPCGASRLPRPILRGSLIPKSNC
jgi:dTDP-4-amino-4,6-dideoxygalactose transaminase